MRIYRNNVTGAPRFKVAHLPGSPLLLWFGPWFVRVGHTSRWETFDPRDGIPLSTHRFELVARIVARRTHRDYARHGEGWGR